MRQGENWAVLGPNGAGKSTLVKLILGENLQAYANQIFLFGGAERFRGESIWEIRKRIGVVSAELQVQYRKKMNACEVIASGFYDSIGLYQAPTPQQRVAVDRWVDFLGIKDLAKQPLSSVILRAEENDPPGPGHGQESHPAHRRRALSWPGCGQPK